MVRKKLCKTVKRTNAFKKHWREQGPGDGGRERAWAIRSGVPSATACLCWPWARHLIESRAQFDTGIRVFPTQDGRVRGASCLSGTLLAPLLNQGLPKCRGLAGGEAVCHLALGPAVTSVGAFTFCCPRLPLSPTFAFLPWRPQRSPVRSCSTQMTW